MVSYGFRQHNPLMAPLEFFQRQPRYETLTVDSTSPGGILGGQRLVPHENGGIRKLETHHGLREPAVSFSGLGV